MRREKRSAHGESRRARRALRLAPLGLAAVAAGQILGAGVAHAATGTEVSAIGGTLKVTARAGVPNDIKIGLVNSTFTVSDRDLVVPGAGCVSINKNTAECSAAGVIGVHVSSGDQADFVTAPVPFKVTVLAGTGDDQATTGVADDTMQGGDGIDRFIGGAGADVFHGQAGSDSFDGGAGRDTMEAGLVNDGADVFNGGADSDIADYSDRSANLVVRLDDVATDGALGENDDIRTDVEEILGGAGKNELTGSNLPTVQNRLVGGDGDDTLTGLAGRDVLFAKGGTDTIVGGDGNDDLSGGTGADTLSGGAGDDEAIYTERTARVVVDLDDQADDGETNEKDNVGSDVEDVSSGSGNDRLVGSAGNNDLSGGSNDDVILGQGGSDSVFGDFGRDVLSGDAAPTVTLIGVPGEDFLLGGEGNDSLNGGDLSDVMRGGPGTDKAAYPGRATDVIANLDGLANDGSIGENDEIEDDVEDLEGGNGSDTLTGNAQANFLHGGTAGSDKLFGQAGNDTLEGFIGFDHLDCGADVDSAFGGPQTDTAVGCETTFDVP